MSSVSLRDFQAINAWGADSQSETVRPAIPFNQSSDLICKLDPNKHKTLLGFNERFGGLCELVCNRILIDDLLGKGKDVNSIRNRVTVERMDEDKIKKSHLLDVYSIFRRALAYLFGIYPDNIFSCGDQWSLVKNTSTGNNVVNRQILGQGLKNIAAGETLKLEVFSKSGFNLSGHSLLIKKTDDDKYIFFDPNTGEQRDLSLVQLSDNIDAQLAQWNGTDICLIKGKDYLQRL